MADCIGAEGRSLTIGSCSSSGQSPCALGHLPAPKHFVGDIMADDLKNRGPQDRSRVSVNEPYEVNYWTKELGVTNEQLRELVREYGVSVAKIREVLSKRRGN